MKSQHLAHWAKWAADDIGLKVQYKLAYVRYTPARALCMTQDVVQIVYMHPVVTVSRPTHVNLNHFQNKPRY